MVMTSFSILGRTMLAGVVCTAVSFSRPSQVLAQSPCTSDNFAECAFRRKELRKPATANLAAMPVPPPLAVFSWQKGTQVIPEHREGGRGKGPPTVHVRARRDFLPSEAEGISSVARYWCLRVLTGLERVGKVDPCHGLSDAAMGKLRKKADGIRMCWNNRADAYYRAALDGKLEWKVDGINRAFGCSL